MVFQLTRNTEAPVELNIDFPQWRILDMAENANSTQHNILAPRGTMTRDAKAWADSLTESIRMFGNSDAVITSHGWPRFGREYIDDYLGKQRDYYEFLHDQTVRLLNDGLTGDDIAARLKLPAELQKEPYDQPFYGSLSFNVRAVYQYYMGWYDANPVHLAPMTPEQAGQRYVAAMGGAPHVLALAKEAFQTGDYAWAAELLNREIFSGESGEEAKSLLASCYEHLGWASENALWRNMYLTGAKELRTGVTPAYPGASNSPLLASLPTADIFDVLATRLDDQKAAGVTLRLEIIFPERNEQTYVTVRDGVLIHQPGEAQGPADATLILPRAAFVGRMFYGRPLSAASKADPAMLDRLSGLLEAPKANFPIVTP